VNKSGRGEYRNQKASNGKKSDIRKGLKRRSVRAPEENCKEEIGAYPRDSQIL